MGDHTVALRAHTSPRVIRITKAGWLYIILTLFLGFAAVNTGNNLLFLIVSAFLSFMGISGFFGKRNLSGLDIRIDPPEEIYATTMVPIKVTLRNRRKLLPAFLITVRVMDTEVLFPFVDTQETASRYLTLSFHKRGRMLISDIHICSVFPFNFFVRCRRVPAEVETIVFPRTIRCDLFDTFVREQRQRGEKNTDRVGYDADLISLRDYITGDPLKYIHWKASAKTDQLKTKELSSLYQRPVIIDFDAVPIRDIEERISCITYVILMLFKRHVPVGLKMKDTLLKPRIRASSDRLKESKLGMLRKLALYDEI